MTDRSRYILEGDPHKVKGRLMRDILVYDANGHKSVAVEVPNANAMDMLDALRAAYQQGREDNAQSPSPAAKPTWPFTRHDAPYPGPGEACPHGGGVYAPAFRCGACTLLDTMFRDWRALAATVNGQPPEGSSQ